MKNLSKFFISALIVAIAAVGCEDPQEGAVDDELYDENMNEAENTALQTGEEIDALDDDDDMEMNKALVVIHSNDMNLDAWVTFSEVEEGVRVHGRFEGFPEGMHAYHVHVSGDCRADDYSSAGPHYVFDPPAPENAPIVGNLGEFSADPSGVVMTDTVIAAIDELEDLIGRAVVVHAQGNNLNPPPTGNAGSRIACGVIGYANTGSTHGGMDMDMDM